MAGTNRLLRWISVSMLVIGPVVLWSQFASSDNRTWQESVTGAVAALVGMVPEGLVLLTSVAFVVATVTLSRHHTLVQELPAVEALARVDVVCLDKTGTITHGDVVVDEVRHLRRRRRPHRVRRRGRARPARRGAGPERHHGGDRRRLSADAVGGAVPGGLLLGPQVVRGHLGRPRHLGARRTGD